MKAVLLSSKPKYCELIADGKKTIEVRKSKPKLKTPFKCYIYCTKAKEKFQYDSIVEYLDELYRLPNGEIKYGWSGELMCYEGYGKDNFLNGKIIGEFICDEIKNYRICVGIPVHLVTEGCISAKQIMKYSNNGLDDLYAWHISDLKIYDEPKELSEFYSVCPEWEKEEITNKCHKCSYLLKNDSDMCYQCSIEGEKHIKRPPQSWCYVEERETK